MGTTLHDQAWHSQEHLLALESFLGKEYTCATANVQSAVQACLELLGTRSVVVPVILPVTAPPDTLAGVLRAGAHPLLLDIDEDNLQIDADQLKEAIETLVAEENTPIVLFNRPFGNPIEDELLELVQELPTIMDSRLLPSSYLDIHDLACVFNIFDLTTVCGAGAVIIHKFPAQIQQLKQVRSGPMGLSAALPELLAEEALKKLEDFAVRANEYDKALEVFDNQYPVCGFGYNPGLVWLEVPDAVQLGSELIKEGVETALGVVPLYILEEVKSRFSEDPSYPVVSSLINNYLCVPADEEACKKVKKLL